MRRGVRVAVVGVLLLGTGLVAGCGDDDEDEGATSEEFCDLARELNEAEGFPEGERMDAYVDAAPDEIKDEAELAIDAIKEQGEDAFGDEEVIEAVEAIERLEADECDIQRPE